MRASVLGSLPLLRSVDRTMWQPLEREQALKLEVLAFWPPFVELVLILLNACIPLSLHGLRFSVFSSENPDSRPISAPEDEPENIHFCDRPYFDLCDSDLHVRVHNKSAVERFFARKAMSLLLSSLLIKLDLTKTSLAVTIFVILSSCLLGQPIFRDSAVLQIGRHLVRSVRDRLRCASVRLTKLLRRLVFQSGRWRASRCVRTYRGILGENSFQIVQVIKKRLRRPDSGQ